MNPAESEKIKLLLKYRLQYKEVKCVCVCVLVNELVIHLIKWQLLDNLITTAALSTFTQEQLQDQDFVLPIPATLYFYSTAFYMYILYCISPTVTFQIKMSSKTYDHLIKYDPLLQIKLPIWI